MKSTNMQSDVNPSLFERIIKRAGDKLEQVPVSPRCWNIIMYEPTLPEEVIMEMSEVKK